MYDCIPIPETGNFICAVDVSKGTDVPSVISFCQQLRDELNQKGVSSDRFTIVPIGSGSPIKDVEIIPDNRSVALWVEYPRPHYFKCSVCNYTVPYKKAMPFRNSCSYRFCPSCGRVIIGWTKKGDKIIKCKKE